MLDLATEPDIQQARSVSTQRPRLLIIVLELALLIVGLYSFQIETENHFHLLLPFVFLGFVLSLFTPFEYRQYLFLLLSVLAIFQIAGPFSASLILGIGLLLILICHLPSSYGFRISLLLITGMILVLLRIWIKPQWSHVVVTAVASMFMFRLLLYVNELKQKKLQPASIPQRLSYFFLLPNICFPLFPVIDFKTFLRTYYDNNAIEIYQKGIRWMLRGFLHLLLYRMINYHFALLSREVNNLAQLAQYLITSYMLLLRISGQAYLILGILCLFGFNLPPAFNKYFLASGFNDLWRRANIYWKDFITKIFHYRVYFLFKNLGLVISTFLTLLIIYFIVLFLHAYQFFWIQGTFRFSEQDALFWGIFGICVAVNSIFQLRGKTNKSAANQPVSFAAAMRKSAQVVAFFLCMCVLWSLWLSLSTVEWYEMMLAVPKSGLKDFIWMALILLSAVFLGACAHYQFMRAGSKLQKRRSFEFSVSYAVVALLILLGTGMFAIRAKTQSRAGRFVTSLTEHRMNKRDSSLQELSYYEPLLNANRMSVMGSAQTITADIWEEPREDDEPGLLMNRLRPSTTAVFKGAIFTTNRWGMRDKEYALKKEPGTVRFAIVGASIELGAGVTDHEVFESLVERRLNTYQTGKVRKYEILNFSKSGYDFIENVKVYDTKVFAFQPDVILFVVHQRDFRMPLRHLSDLIKAGADLEYDEIKDICRKAGVTDRMPEEEVKRRLFPYAGEIYQWALARVSQKCRTTGAMPVWLHVPMVSSFIKQPDYVRKMQKILQSERDAAKKMGFITIDISEAYAGHDPGSISVSQWDDHPNPFGHRLLASVLYRRIIENQSILGLKL